MSISHSVAYASIKSIYWCISYLYILRIDMNAIFLLHHFVFFAFEVWDESTSAIDASLLRASGTKFVGSKAKNINSRVWALFQIKFAQVPNIHLLNLYIDLLKKGTSLLKFQIYIDHNVGYYRCYLASSSSLSEFEWNTYGKA